MKKHLLIISLISLSLSIVAQSLVSKNINSNVLLFEDFESGIFPPANWTVIDGSVSANHWVDTVYEAYTNGTTTATVFYQSAVQQDEWLITPVVSIPTNITLLHFDWSTKFSLMASPDFGDFLVYVSNDGGSNWNIILDDDNQTSVENSGVEYPWAEYAWNHSAINLSDYLGQDIQIAFQYYSKSAPASLMIDNVRILELDAGDVGVVSADLPPFSAIGSSVVIQGEYYNYGYQSVNSVDIKWSVNGGAEHTKSLTGLNVSLLSTASFTHSINWVPDVVGYNTIKIWSENVNGDLGLDTDHSNDTLTQTVYIADQLAQRMALFEGFTSTTCSPCAYYNPGIDALLSSNIGKIIAVKYHQNFPSPGDPMYSYNGTTNYYRFNYYDGSYVPYGIIGTDFADNSGNLNQTIINTEYAKPAPFSIDGTYSVTDKTVTINGEITSLVDLPSNDLVYQIVIIENNIHYTTAPTPSADNGERDFSHVMRKMLPDYYGTEMTSQTANQITSFSQTYTFTDEIVNLEEIQVVVFIQDDATREIHQTAIMDYTTKVSSIDFNNQITVYPNPTRGIIFVSNVENSELKVYDILGSNVLSMESKEFEKSINVSDFKNGVYFVVINKDGETTTKKIIISK